MSMSLGMLGLAAACLVEERDSVGVGGVDWFSSLGSEPTPDNCLLFLDGSGRRPGPILR